MRKLFVGLALVLAVMMFAAEFKLAWSGWVEQGFVINKDGKIKYEQSGRVSISGVTPVSQDVDFFVSVSLLNFFRDPRSSSPNYIFSAYAMITLADNLTISVGPRTFSLVYYDNVWGDADVTYISQNRLSLQYKVDALTLTIGAFRSDNWYTFDNLAKEIAALAQLNLGPVYAGVSFDASNQSYYLYGKATFADEKLGSTISLDAGLKGAAGSGLPTFDLGALLLSQKIGQMDFGLKVNYHKLLLTNPQPAEIGLWFNYVLDPKLELTLKTYFETKTDASTIYASIELPWKFSKNLTAIPKVEFDKDGFKQASFKFKYSFK